MADISTLIEEIDENIIPNNNAQLITGEGLNTTLKDIVEGLSERGYIFKGVVASTTYNPTEDYPSCYLLTAAGTYANFDAYVVPAGKVALVHGDGTGMWEGTNFNNFTDAEKAKLESLPTGESLDVSLDYIRQGVENLQNTTEALEDNVADLQSDLTNKANKDGYYEQMGVGVADNLAGKGDGVPAEFTRRTTGGTASVADGVATIKSIQGNTIVWNQLVNYTWPFASKNGITATRDGNKTHLQGTTNALYNYTIYNVIQGKENHRYLILVKGFRGGAWNKMQVYTNNANLPLSLNNEGAIVSCFADGTYPLIFSIWANQTIDLTIYDPICIDLTQMFGAGNEPSTVEEFEALFPNGYYPYNAGQLLSFNGDGIVTDGFNQFDGSKARVLGGKAYYINGTYSTIKFAKTIDGEQTTITPTNHLYTPTEDGYIFATGTSADFCINLSWSGVRNGEYEPHWQETRNIPAVFSKTYTGADGQQHTWVGLDSTGAVYDEQTPTKDIQRIGVVDMGTLVWGISTLETFTKAARALVPGMASGVEQLRCARFSYLNIGESAWISDNNPNETITANGGRIGISSSSFVLGKTVSELKASLAGVLLFYPLATPVETDYEEPRNLSYKVSDFGTETLLPEGVDESGVPKTAPFNGSIVYGMNAVDTLRNLPKNFISVESFDDFCAKLATAQNLTISKVWDATSGKYVFTISANE